MVCYLLLQPNNPDDMVILHSYTDNIQPKGNRYTYVGPFEDVGRLYEFVGQFLTHLPAYSKEQIEAISEAFQQSEFCDDSEPVVFIKEKLESKGI